MAKQVSVQEGGITFGDWKLFPVDSHNWELCHRHATGGSGSGAGVVKWHRVGRFYQYGTFPLAIQYAADRALKDKAYGEQMELLDALHEYDRIVDGMKADVLAALGGDA